MIDKFKLHMIVEYIKQFVFEFEIIDVIENLADILTFFGFGEMFLTDEELNLLVKELLPLAEGFEFREAAYLAMQDDFWVMCNKGSRVNMIGKEAENLEENDYTFSEEDRIVEEVQA